MNVAPATTKDVVAALRAGDGALARRLAGELIGAGVDRRVKDVSFTMDAYSLNSVSGLVQFEDGDEAFFKFHHEEGEEAGVSEYYRAQLLADAGLPTERPTAVVNRPGYQLVLYPLRRESRMADRCLAIEREDPFGARLPSVLGKAQRALDRRIGEVCVATMSPPRASSTTSSIHQLFFHRLVDDGRFPGGRYRHWYQQDSRARELLDLEVVVNGRRYARTLGEVASFMHELLDPVSLAAWPVVTAHGDDHHGNVWVLGEPSATRLTLFDPAFAADDIPVVLAPVKATFHNALAHPMWLYHPEEAKQTGGFDASIEGGTLVARIPELSPLRREILSSLLDNVWRPLLAAVHRRGQLTANWRTVIRAALAACPLLVTNLMDPKRDRTVSLCSLAWVVMAASAPDQGEDIVCELLDRIDPERVA